MQVIEFKGHPYPEFQSQGNASQFAIPFAKYFCKGNGYDIGCMKPEWAFPGAMPIDVDFNDPYHADHLPEAQVDYIFSSHCLEHVPDWVSTLIYWTEKIKSGGVLFLYLPHYDKGIGDPGIIENITMFSFQSSWLILCKKTVILMYSIVKET